MSTLKNGSGEVIAKMHPLPTDVKIIRRYRQALEDHLCPLPAGLHVEIVPVMDDQSPGQLLIMHVPPQPDTAKPFPVVG